jgi:hypothetical protein
MTAVVAAAILMSSSGGEVLLGHKSDALDLRRVHEAHLSGTDMLIVSVYSGRTLSKLATIWPK